LKAQKNGSYKYYKYIFISELMKRSFFLYQGLFFIWKHAKLDESSSLVLALQMALLDESSGLVLALQMALVDKSSSLVLALLHESSSSVLVL
jgi:hypothetical protein